MKDIFTAPFVEEMKRTCSNMYRLGWDERNGGNISYLLDEAEVALALALALALELDDWDEQPTQSASKLANTIVATIIDSLFILVSSQRYKRTKSTCMLPRTVRIAPTARGNMHASHAHYPKTRGESHSGLHPAQGKRELAYFSIAAFVCWTYTS